MSIPGNAEPGAFSRQQQVQHQQTIPIKKRRFPVIQACSLQEESPSGMENKEKSNVDDGGLSSGEAINTASVLAQTSVTAVKKEVVPTDTPSGQANASKPVEEKPRNSLGTLDDLGNNNKVGLQNEKSSEPKNLDSSMIAQSRTSDVKREIVSAQTEGASGKMNVELSLGPKEPLVPALKTQNEAILHSSDKSDSLLSLALHKEKAVKCDKTTDTVSNPVCANRSNWDLNTTMDVWEGSTTSDAAAHGLVNIGGFSKTSSYHDDTSSLTVATTAFLGSDKAKQVLDGHASSSLKSSTQLCKTDVSLGLRLAMANMDTNWKPSSLSGNLDFTSVSPALSLKQVQLPIVIASRTVKSEPVDDNSKLDCSIGSSSSNNTESPKLTTVKRECANSHSIVTNMQSYVSPEKLDDRRLIKSEVVQERKQEELKSKDADMPSFARVMQHQESCASSSPLPISLLSQGPSPPRLLTCSELTTAEEFSNQSEQSFHSKESRRNDVPDELTATTIRQNSNQLKLCRLGTSSVVDQDKCRLARIDEHTVKSCQKDVEEKVNISSEMHEEDTLVSDSVSQQNCAVDTVSEKEDEEYEDGEVREIVLHSAEGDPILEGKDSDNLELVKSDSQNLQPSVPSADQIVSESDAMQKNLDENHGYPIKDCVSVCNEPNNENKSLQESYEVSEVVADDTRAVNAIADREIDPSGEDVEESPRKEVYRDIPTDGSHANGIEIGGEDTAKVVTESCSVENDSTLSKVEVSPNDNDSAKDLNNASNKSRIINLSRPSVMAAPFRTKSISNRLMTSRSGKERYSDFSGDVQPRGNRDEFYTGGSNKFVKDRVHDQSVRNSRPTFMRGKGRASGYFGSGRGRGRGDWDSRHDFASESSYGQSDYRVIRRKHASSADGDLENNGYNIPQDGNRNKTINDEFPSQRRGSFRRLSAGDRDGLVSRGFQMLRRAPRNMSPRRSGEAGSDMIGLGNDEKFMQHISDDIINPIYSHPQAMYEEHDNQQLVRGNRNFSTTLQRKGYPRIHSKSPVRSRTRSPGPWGSPRRRSPNGVPEHGQHRSPAFFRMGRMRSPDQSCFHDEMVARRRGSPSYVARHNNDLRDVDSGREHIHPRSADSNRRSSPGRGGFLRGGRRADGLDSREMGDGDEYLNGPSHSNKFHELHGDDSIDDRRKFNERRGPQRPFRSTNYNNHDNENFRFHPHDGVRPYRFCPDVDPEFAERSNTRETEFDGRIKHQNLVGPRRIRNIEDQQDGNYRPVERVWHEDGFTDGRVKRRRF